jgi:hypothetical protein
MAGSGTILLLDTNVIIESVRTKCWNGLRGHYTLVTVQKCREEAWSGDLRSPGYVVVEKDHLESGIEITSVTDEDRARLLVECPDASVLDDGERDLFAHALAGGDDWRVVFADKAAVRVAVLLGWGDRLVSLEEIIKSAGLRPKPPLKDHYSSRILSVWRTGFILDGNSDIE